MTGNLDQIDVVEGYDALHLFLNSFLDNQLDQGMLRTLADGTDRPDYLNEQPTDLALWRIWTECVDQVIAKRSNLGPR
ncbi:hypothetical protein [Sphingomonas sp.]|uniref:hypothetical protein n=1 Tax=Sphingomonas sp. TaxID=28214 RepID=UPI003B004157